MKNSIFLIVFLIFVSCKPNEIVLFDEFYFAITNSKLNKIRRVDINNLKITDFYQYKKIIISPMLYKQYKEEWNDFNGELYIIEGSISHTSENIQNITVSDSNAYIELVELLKKNKDDYKKISIIIDYMNSSHIADSGYLQELEKIFEINYLYIEDITNKNLVVNFIDNNANTDLWIINSKTLGFLAYEQIKNGDILMKSGGQLRSLNSKLKYSIDFDVNDQIRQIFNNKNTVIYTNLKKY